MPELEPQESQNPVVPVIIGCFLLLFLSIGGIVWKNTLGVANANADRAIYQGSASYIDGKNQLIAKLRRDYTGISEPARQRAMAAYIRTEVSQIDLSKLTQENREFVKSLN
jgi:hypothetical protein